jgi:hypothetical protein
LAAKISALSIGNRITAGRRRQCRPVVLRVERHKFLERSSANSAARLVSILRLVFTTAKRARRDVGKGEAHFSGSDDVLHGLFGDSCGFRP